MRMVIEAGAADALDRVRLDLAIAVKTLSNYSNHVFHAAVDGQFAGFEWTGTSGSCGTRRGSGRGCCSR